MAYADFTYYSTSYLGNVIAETDFSRLALRASAVIDQLTFSRATSDTDNTIAIKVEGANDIISAAAVSGAPYSTIGRKAIVPKANTPESTSVKASAAREITCTVAVEALTVGKLTGYLYYVEGIASA